MVGRGFKVEVRSEGCEGAVGGNDGGGAGVAGIMLGGG